jgi:hypothetical protein
MRRIYYDKTPTDSVDALLSRFKGKALQSPMRSTVPLLDMVLHAQSQLASTLESCGAEPKCVRTIDRWKHLRWTGSTKKPRCACGSPDVTD